MKYTLIIGIEYKKFKNPANITLSVNDRFIDCFSLDRDYGVIDNVLPMIHSKWYDQLGKSHWLDPKTHNRKYWEVVKLPKLIKIYQIDDEHLGGNLDIQVENENSDFTNGFMKNSSLVKIPLIGLFPSHMSVNYGEKLLKTVARLNVSYNPNCTYKINKISQQNAFTHRHNWPLVDSFFIQRESEIYEKSRPSSVNNKIGGSFNAKIPVERKHKLFFLGSTFLNKKGYFLTDYFSLCVASYKPLLNIYNEDQ